MVELEFDDEQAQLFAVGLHAELQPGSPEVAN